MEADELEWSDHDSIATSTSGDYGEEDGLSVGMKQLAFDSVSMLPLSKLGATDSIDEDQSLSSLDQPLIPPSTARAQPRRARRAHRPIDGAAGTAYTCTNLFMMAMFALATPVVIAWVVICFVVWLCCTVSGISPLLNFALGYRDNWLVDRKRLLNTNPELRLVEVPGHVNSASDGRPYYVICRWTQPAQSKRLAAPPVLLVGHIGEPLLHRANLQDVLTSIGFSVLTYDRLGVGLSDDNPTGRPASAVDVTRELDYVLQAREMGVDRTERWLAVGAGMGMLVLTSFMALSPHKFLGVVNVDGVPSAIVRCSRRYLAWNAPLFRVLARLHCTGLVRAISRFAGWNAHAELHSQSLSFDRGVASALVRRPQYVKSMALEYFTMVSCAELSNAAWKSQAALRLTTDELELLTRADHAEIAPNRGTAKHRNPSAHVELEEFMQEFSRRKIDAPVDVRTAYSENGRACVGFHQGGVVPEDDHAYALTPQWRRLVVRVMRLGAYDTGNHFIGLLLFPQRLRDWYAAEQTIHAFLAMDGRKTVFPALKLGDGMTHTSEVARLVSEVAEILQARSQIAVV